MMGSPHSLSPASRGLLRCGLLLALVVVVVVVPRSAALAGTEPSRCGAPQQQGTPALVGEQPARAKADPADLTALVFARSRGHRILDLRPDIIGEPPSPGALVGTVVRLFARSDGESMPPGQVVVTQAVVSRDRTHIQIQVCVDPARPNDVAPGTYSGKIVIDDPSFEPASFEMTVVLQETRWYVPLLLLLAAAVVASAAQWLVPRRGQLMDKNAGTATLRRLLGEGRGELVLGFVAAFAAGIPVYFAHYEHDPDWILDFTHGWGFVTTALAAAAGGYSAVSRIRRDAPQASEAGAPE